MGKRRRRRGGTETAAVPAVPGPLLSLSDDLLVRISHMVMEPILSWVCRRLRRLLHGYHVSSRSWSCPAIAAWAPRLRTVIVDVPNRFMDHGKVALLASALGGAPALHYLRLRLCGVSVGVGVSLRALRALRAVCSVKEFHLDVSRAALQGAEVAELAAFMPPELRELHLVLGHNHLYPGDVRSLARLRELTALQRLHLDLHDNRLDASDTRALATVIQGLRLTALHLHLGRNQLPAPAIPCLAAAIAGCPTLQCLDLDLSGNALGLGGAVPLSGCRCLPALRSCRLVLHDNGLGPVDAHALAAFSEAPALDVLDLDLGRNLLSSSQPRKWRVNPKAYCTSHCDWYFCLGGDDVAEAEDPAGVDADAIAALPPAPADPAVAVGALAALAQAPGLRRLTLRLDHTRLPLRAAQALASLAAGPALRRLALDVRRNDLGVGGVRALCGLQAVAGPALVELWVDASGNGLPLGDGPEDADGTLALLGWRAVPNHRLQVSGCWSLL
eukprot:EG_transcript_10338